MTAPEKWLFQNKTALQQMQQGLQDAAEGKLEDLGDFSTYLDK